MAGQSSARVSVVIPARNEEANIASAVRSAAGQQGIKEIIVIDDASTDRTGEILEGLKQEIPALKVLHVDALPEGWTGKSHAAAIGARASAGDWLLFADADTVQKPGSLADLLKRAEHQRADLLSLSPGQVTETWWEKSVIPLVYVHLAKLFKFEDVSDPASPAAAANGQYLLIRREVYERIGGHEAVRDKILEDVELARHVKMSGGKLLFLPGAEWAQTRMYRTFGAMWQGWTKNLYLLYGSNSGRILGTLSVVAIGDLILPLLFLAACAAFALGQGGNWVAELTLGLFVLMLARHGNYCGALSRLGFDPRLANYLFPGAALFVPLLVNSMLAHRAGRGIQWKGRSYPATKRGEK